MKKPFFSVIIPTYNVENYIEKCLQSINGQTYKNFEVLVIDDGSKDLSGLKAKTFCSSKTNFFYYKKKNSGLAGARNYGFHRAKGDYILYIDSDDFIDRILLEEAYKILRKSKFDFLNYGFDFVDENDRSIKSFSKFKLSIVQGKNIFKKALLEDQIYSVAWNKIYSNDFLRKHKIEFPLIRFNEDSYYSKIVSRFSNHTVFMSGIYYHALIRQSSLSRNLNVECFSITKDLIKLEESDFKLNQLPPVFTFLFYSHVLRIFSRLLMTSSFRMKKYSDLLLCFDFVKSSNFFIYAKNKKITKFLPLKNKILVFLCNFPFLLRFIAKTLNSLRIRPY
jgi:glycosyltransferase involved in cell wall biosynthesis